MFSVHSWLQARMQNPWPLRLQCRSYWGQEGRYLGVALAFLSHVSTPSLWILLISSHFLKLSFQSLWDWGIVLEASIEDTICFILCSHFQELLHQLPEFPTRYFLISCLLKISLILFWIMFCSEKNHHHSSPLISLINLYMIFFYFIFIRWIHFMCFMI